MRSRSQIREKGLAQEPFPGPMKGHSLQRSQDTKQSHHNKDPHNESEATPPSPKSQSGKGHQQKDLSRDDLLFLLSILEGELQARDEVITILKAEKVDLALLEAQYGFATPKKVLQALQRDAIQAKAAPWQEDIYERPMNELDKVMERCKESHKRILNQLLMAENAHRQTVLELEEERRRHKEFVEKNDAFISILEQEYERSRRDASRESQHGTSNQQLQPTLTSLSFTGRLPLDLWGNLFTTLEVGSYTS
ncbi:filamin A-interacting protein 1-like [Suncus etruscus]|uniref:filamin A-interacting protein 1-like n=1 Tax=Suncus etruscus TaxID=109475 RepID=UPI0021103E24|nr:filamin A-interacting protein 1-like [Suncus etruscus]